jgi:tetratricopeptide (TPR) repeat protein
MLEADPENSELQDWLAFVYYSNGMWDAAIRVYEKLIRNGYRVPTQRLYLGNALFKKGLRVLALNEWRKAAEIDDHGTIARKAKERILSVEDAPSSSPDHAPSKPKKKPGRL